MGSWYAVCLVALLLLLLSVYSLAQNSTHVMVVDVRDTGDAWVYMNMTVDDAPTLLTVHALGEIYFAEAFNSAGEELPLNYTADTIQVQVYENTTVELKYYTSLAWKQGKIWVINTTLYYPAEIILPRGAVVLYTSPVPENIVYLDSGRTALWYGSGKIYVEYMMATATETVTETETLVTTLVMPATLTAVNPAPGASGTPTRTSPAVAVTPTRTAPATAPGTATRAGGGGTGSPWPVYAVIVAVALGVFTLALLVLRRRAGGLEPELAKGLDERDKAILRAIGELGGTATVNEIMEKTGIPKTPLYRRLNKLVRLGVLEEKNMGKNKVYRIKNR